MWRYATLPKNLYNYNRVPSTAGLRKPRILRFPWFLGVCPLNIAASGNPRVLTSFAPNWPPLPSSPAVDDTLAAVFLKYLCNTLPWYAPDFSKLGFQLHANGIYSAPYRLSSTCFNRQITSPVLNRLTKFCDDRTEGVSNGQSFLSPAHYKDTLFRGGNVFWPIWLIYSRNVSFCVNLVSIDSIFQKFYSFYCF